MKRLGRIDRLLILVVLGSFLWLTLFGKLVYVQLIKGPKYKVCALSQHKKHEIVYARRGSIYDRNGRILAKSAPALSFFVERTKLKHLERVDSTFTHLMGIEPGYVIDRVNTTRKDFIYLTRNVDITKGNKLRLFESDTGFSSRLTYERIYPLGHTASQLLGLLDIERRGSSGLEMYYDSLLSGKDSEMYVLSQASGKTNDSFILDGEPPKPGYDLYLTIDAELQQIVESELMESVVDSYGAKSATAVFMRPSTGEVLAIASYPTFNPNNRSEYNPNASRLRAITDTYEPGSVFKIVPFAALISMDAISLDEKVDCEMGEWFFCDDTIHDAEKHGIMSARSVLIHSSNIGTIKLALKVPSDTLYSFASRLGFGSLTEIDMVGEVKGLLNKPYLWSGMTPAAFPMGHEVTVTAIQLAVAYSVVANRGIMVKPHLVDRIAEQNGETVYYYKPFKVRRVIQEACAETLCSLFEAVVDSGTGVHAAIEGISVAGKTGTAEKVKEKERGYHEDKFISTFVGFAPVESPQIVGVVVVDEPTRGLHWGGWTAAPIWRRIVNKAFVTGVIDPAGEENIKTRPAAIKQYVAVPDVHRMTGEQAIEILHNRGLLAETTESGYVISQSPQSGKRVPPGTTVMLALKPAGPDHATSVRIPSVIGMPLRDAASEFAQANVKFGVIGSGVVTSQTPSGGSLISRDEVCLISCEKNR